MKIITSDMPKYTVVFNHPDDSSATYEFFVDFEGAEEPWTEGDYEIFEKEFIKMVWHKYNHYGYYHTMTITAEYVIDDKIYHPYICKEIGCYELPD